MTNTYYYYIRGFSGGDRPGLHPVTRGAAAPRTYSTVLQHHTTTLCYNDTTDKQPTQLSS